MSCRSPRGNCICSDRASSAASRLPGPSEYQLHCMVVDTVRRRWRMPGWIYTHIASGEVTHCSLHLSIWCRVYTARQPRRRPDDPAEIAPAAVKVAPQTEAPRAAPPAQGQGRSLAEATDATDLHARLHAQAPDDSLEPGIAVGARDLPTARGP